MGWPAFLTSERKTPTEKFSIEESLFIPSVESQIPLPKVVPPASAFLDSNTHKVIQGGEPIQEVRASPPPPAEIRFSFLQSH